ncbi:PAS domain S-box protein, partial [bacterium]|nr:PAS domain S-box protein [bacterium]
PEGAGWQRLQLISLAFFVPAIVTFVSTYTRRRLGWVEKGFYLYYLAAILVQSLDRSSLTIDLSQPSVKHILLPFDLQITYYEATLGPFTVIQALVGMAASGYVFYCAIRHYRSGHRREAAPLLLAISLMFAAGLNDTLVSNGGYQFIYLIEYGYMSIILLMAYSISNTVVEAAQIQMDLQQANLVVENSPVVLFRWKAAEGWPVELVSRNVTQFGYTPEELLSGSVPFREMIHPDDLARVVREVREHTESGAERFNQEYRILTRDGRVRWTDDRTVVERDRNGEVVHYEGILIDITDRKLADKERERLISDLEAKNAELESFTDTASRDLKIPLSEIRRLLRSLEEDVTKGDRARLKENIEKAVR